LQQDRLLPLTDSQRELLQEATGRYQASMTARAEDWLAARGLGEGTVFTARIGVVDDPLPGHEPYRGWLAIPYIADGHPVSLRFRCLRDHDHSGHGKYMSLPDEAVRIYQATPAREISTVVHIAEGELDALVLAQAGLPAVGVPGAHSWRPRHTRLLSGCPEIRSWGDPDKAGIEFNTHICKQLRQAKPVRLDPAIGDVTETFLRGGTEALYELAA
jgi:hypothetical protein